MTDQCYHFANYFLYRTLGRWEDKQFTGHAGEAGAQNVGIGLPDLLNADDALTSRRIKMVIVLERRGPFFNVL